MTTSRKSGRVKQTVKAHKIRRIVAVAVVAVGIVSVVVCGYGHAALNTDLQISGEATVKLTDSFGITYMQKMTSEICSNAKTGTEERLIDERDGRQYWVKKMTNNECWMLQNLAYDITAERIANNEINSLNTDLRYSSTAGYEKIDDVYYWNSKSKYPPQATHMLTNGQAITKATNSRSTTYSWNFGEFINITPNTTTTCGNLTNLNRCSSSFQRVKSDDRPTWRYAGSNRVYDTTTKTYDAHFLVGNYYQFNTITAGSAEGNSGKYMDASLCPKGWQLPRDEGARSWQKLFSTEGFGAYVTMTKNGEKYYASSNPVYAMRTGAVLVGSAAINDVQNRGYIWTAYGNTAGNAAFLRLYQDGLYYAYKNYRYYGLNARCVAR